MVWLNFNQFTIIIIRYSRNQQCNVKFNFTGKNGFNGSNGADGNNIFSILFFIYFERQVQKHEQNSKKESKHFFPKITNPELYQSVVSLIHVRIFGSKQVCGGFFPTCYVQLFPFFKTHPFSCDLGTPGPPGPAGPFGPRGTNKFLLFFIPSHLLVAFTWQLKPQLSLAILDQVVVSLVEKFT